MTRGRGWIAGLIAAGAMLPGSALAAAGTPAGLSADVDRREVSTQLGRGFEVRSTITNSGTAPASGLVAHLSVLSLRPDPYVDPEDWSSQRVVFLDPIAAGRSTTLRWKIKAVNAGTFGLFVTVLSTGPGGGPPSNTPVVRLNVSERRTLNAGGILPLAIAIPALLGLLALVLRVQRRG
jgi:hypothetical protein